jgi:glycerol-3-phosphate dehydrogenase
MPSPFSPETREATFASLADAPFDVVVIGGGITGAGVARDAALRGLRTAVVEARDWASGTSSRSSKLIHGGVRYLEQGDIGLVREAANERLVLRRIAPHLTVPLRVLMPTYGRASHAKLGVGLWTFEKLAPVTDAERHESLGRDEALRREPLLDGTRLHGAITFTEYLTDDARLVLETAISAQQAGAACVNHAEVTAIALAPHGSEVTVRDTLTGREQRLRARAVVNAAGPWVDEVRRLAGADRGLRLRLTKGIHVVVARERLPVRHMVAMAARDRRSVFAAPRGEFTYLGTTDTDYGEAVEHPDVTVDDVEYLLDAANRTFGGERLGTPDVLATWAGLRPLLDQPGRRPSEISRKDEIMEGEHGFVSIAGGKLTTHRRMAERVVDLVVRRLGRPAGSCRTAELSLPNGTVPAEALPALERRVRGALPGLAAGGAERLVALYGAACERILARAAVSPAAAAPIAGQPNVVRAEIEHALDEEMALTLQDVLERRTRLLLFDARQGLGAAEAVAALAAARLGWDAARTAAELDGYRALAASLRRFT